MFDKKILNIDNVFFFTKKISLIFVIGLFFFLHAHAASPVSSTTVDELIRTGLILLLLIIFLLLVSWGVRRLQSSVNNTRGIRCLESVPIGIKERLILVQVGEAQLLLGVSTGNMQVLHHLASPIEVPEKQPAMPGIRLWLQRLRKH